MVALQRMIQQCDTKRQHRLLDGRQPGALAVCCGGVGTRHDFPIVTDLASIIVAVGGGILRVRLGLLLLGHLDQSCPRLALARGQLIWWLDSSLVCAVDVTNNPLPHQFVPLLGVVFHPGLEWPFRPLVGVFSIGYHRGWQGPFWGRSAKRIDREYQQTQNCGWFWSSHRE